MRWKHWRAHLEQNAHRPIPDTTPPKDLPSPIQQQLLRSLREFQLGEAGEGRIANEIDHVSWPGLDADLRAVVKLWVREEGRHARILGRMVTGMGGTLMRRHWTARSFEGLRRAFGVRFKLLIALAAEVPGTVVYGGLARSLPPCGLAQALVELEEDERAHLAFQAEIFGQLAAGFFAHLLLQGAWAGLSAGVCALVWWRHAGTLAALQVPRGKTWRDLWRCTREVARRIREARPKGGRALHLEQA